MAMIQGPNGLKQDEMYQQQDPSLPSPLGLDMNNPQVQAALANMNVSGFDQPEQPTAPTQAAIDPSTMDKLTAALASSKPVQPPVQAATPEPQEQTPKEIDFTAKPGEKNYSQALRDAQHKRDFNVALDQMVEGSKKAGAAIAGGNYNQFKPDISNEEADIKNAQHFVTDVQDRKKAEGSDPNSGYSKGLRDWAKMTYGIDLKGASAEQVGQIAPYLSKQYEAEQERKNKQELLKSKLEERQFEAGEKGKDRALKLAELGQNAKDKASQKEENDLQNDRYKLDKLLSAETASSRSALGKAANIGRSAEAIDRLANQYKDQNDLDRRQIYEMATSLDAMLKGGVSTISGAEHLIPKTYQGDASKIAEYITGIPKGADQAEFVKRTMETVKREKDLANEQVQKWSKAHAPTFKRLKEKDPETMKAMFKERGIDLDNEGSYSDAQENGIQRVMHDNNVSRDQAVKALKDAGKL